MPIKIASIGYVPPPTVGCAQAFYDNVTHVKHTYDLVLYSDHPWPGALTIKNPELVKSMPSSNGTQNRFAVNNLVFLTGMLIASKLGYTHVCYLESDCRVGPDNWDKVLFDECFSLGKPCIAAGTLACYNPSNYSREANLAWAELVATNWKKNVPVATYGWLPADRKHPSCVFPNGALSVLDVWWMKELFNLDQCVNEALRIAPWDMEIGLKVWDRFAEKSFDMMGFLTSIYSGYADVLTTQEERLRWLEEGRYVAVHQVKGNL